MGIKKETCICIIKSVKHLHIKNHWTSPLMKIKWNRKCTKVCGNTEREGLLPYKQSVFEHDRFALIEHVVVIVFLIVWLVEVLHLLLGPAWPVTGQSVHWTQAVAVIILVIRWWFLRLLQRRMIKYFVIVTIQIVTALKLYYTGFCVR